MGICLTFLIFCFDLDELIEFGYMEDGTSVRENQAVTAKTDPTRISCEKKKFPKEMQMLINQWCVSG